MTENSQKKKPLILESSDDSESSVKSEKETGLSSPSSINSSEKSAPKSDVPSSSSSIPSSSSSIQSSSDSFKISDNLEAEYKKLNCDDENYYSKECNKFLLKKELLERNTLSENEGENQYLYPNLNDKDFNIS
jgi:beta-N-acetylglucosaminidase